MIFKIIRWPLGQLILLVDFLTAPRLPQRPADLQARIDAATSDLALYQFRACPFCVKTRRAMRRLGLNIETHDANSDSVRRRELETGGGRVQVPCLRIPRPDDDPQWLYESNEIIGFLETRVEELTSPAAA